MFTHTNVLTYNLLVIKLKNHYFLYNKNFTKKTILLLKKI